MDDRTAIAAVLLEFRQGVCLDCIAGKTKMVPGSVQETLQRLGGSIGVVPFQGRCGACSKRKTIIALARSPFIVGDLVTSRSHPDWTGEVVDTERFESGYVSVRWRSPSGVLLQAVEEPVPRNLRRPLRSAVCHDQLRSAVHGERDGVIARAARQPLAGDHGKLAADLHRRHRVRLAGCPAGAAGVEADAPPLGVSATRHACRFRTDTIRARRRLISGEIACSVRSLYIPNVRPRLGTACRGHEAVMVWD
jgi:hypothetical protein